MGPGSDELRFFVDFIVHGAVPQNLNFEKVSEKGTSTGVWNAQCTVASRVKRPGLSQFSAQFGPNPGQNPILVAISFLEKYTSET